SVVKGGTIGGILGLVGGAAGVMLASRRYHTIRTLTLPMKTFLVTSSGTFVGIVSADNASRAFEASRNQDLQWYENREERLRREELAQMSFSDRAMAWARRERYTIVGVTWLASMVGSFALVGRNPYLTAQQKIVQARVYAQGLTLAVLVASAAFEISESKRVRRELEARAAAGGAGGDAAGSKLSVDPGHEEEGDLWKEMVAAEEERLKKKHQSLYESHSHSHSKSHAKKQAEVEAPAPAPAPVEKTSSGEEKE
ncbi:hypothetical protein AOCH_005847, partial [Aspergillus ochraceoroseus]